VITWAEDSSDLMTNSSMTTTQPPPWKPWRKLIAWICGIVALGAAGLYFANIYWPYRYRNVEPLLENVFASKITIDHYRRTYFPHPGFVANGLTLRRKNAHGLPPVGTAEELHVQGEWNDLLMMHRSVPLVYVNGLRILIPPVGSQANHEDFPPGSSMDFAGPDTPVERLHLHDAELDVQRTDGGEYRFPIRDLIILNLQRGNTITYSLDMDNAIPTGHIQSHGSFGPLKPQNLGETALSGEFTFRDVDCRTSTVSAASSHRMEAFRERSLRSQPGRPRRCQTLPWDAGGRLPLPHRSMARSTA
jgi:hypothetical protein